MIRILLGLGVISVLVLEAYAIFPGEAIPVPQPTPTPVNKVRHNEISGTRPKEAPKISHKEAHRVTHKAAPERSYPKLEQNFCTRQENRT
jgi:hypothetical protein